MTTTFVLLGAALLLVPGRRHHGPAADAGSVALALDLVAAALRAGRPLGVALEVGAPAGPAAQAAALRAVAALLRLGADPPEAWTAADGDPQLAELGRVVSASLLSGARLADAFARAASRSRRLAATADEARAQRAGVLCAGPLAACFLPAFVCLGIVPTLVGLAAPALHATP